MLLALAMLPMAWSYSFAEPRLLGIGAIGINVSDMDRSVKFFSEALSFEKATDAEFQSGEFDRLTGVFGARVRVVTMKLGDEKVELTEYLTPQGRPVPPDSRSNDLWFQHIAVVVSDMDKAYERVRNSGARPISTEPQRLPDWNKAAGGIRAFYFMDPDGHPLELIYFPPGKGDPRWQKNAGALFLGIDHTAIAVSDTEKSLEFYRDALGMRVAGESRNYGTEQEYLNHVFGSMVRITGLRAGGGPGIEFLEYLTPGDGRPYPKDAKANDLIGWEVNMRAEDTEGLYSKLISGGVTLISPAVADSPAKSLGFKKAFMVRDPDGHALKFVEE